AYTPLRTARAAAHSTHEQQRPAAPESAPGTPWFRRDCFDATGAQGCLPGLNSRSSVMVMASPPVPVRNQTSVPSFRFLDFRPSVSVCLSAPQNFVVAATL